MYTFTVNLDDLAEIIGNVVSDLINDTCPYCQNQGLVNDCLSREDIKEWVLKRYKLSKQKENGDESV